MISRLLAFILAGGVVVALLWLTSNDASFKRLQHRAEVNERIRNECIPQGGQQVIVGWYRGRLVCRLYVPSGRHASVEIDTRNVASSQDFND